MSIETLKPSTISLSKLEEVFATFNKVSSELDTSYKELETKVSLLSEELAATHSARLKELTKKEQLAAKLSSLMDALPGGVIVIDKAGIIREETPVAIDFLGKSFKGNSWLQAMKESSQTIEIYDGEISLKDGRRIQISSKPYGTEEDTIILLTDVSANYHLNILKNREQRLTALGEMSGRMAHQIRTPLSSAILYLAHLSNGKPEESIVSNTQVARKILDRLQQIEKLIEGMLSYIRDGISSTEEFSLNDLLNEVQDAISIQMNSNKGKLLINVPAHHCLVKGNQQALFNAICNLIDNSVQSADYQILVSLELTQTTEHYCIAVKDNGPGIKDSIKEQIFDPFFSTRPVGTGLGLAVVQSVMKAHNGEINIKTPESGGTIFELVIPCNQILQNEDSGIWGSPTQQALISDNYETIQ